MQCINMVRDGFMEPILPEVCTMVSFSHCKRQHSSERTLNQGSYGGSCSTANKVALNVVTNIAVASIAVASIPYGLHAQTSCVMYSDNVLACWECQLFACDMLPQIHSPTKYSSSQVMLMFFA